MMVVMMIIQCATAMVVLMIHIWDVRWVLREWLWVEVLLLISLVWLALRLYNSAWFGLRKNTSFLAVTADLL